MELQRVVFDINLLVDAAPSFAVLSRWPRVPPRHDDNPYADCMGIVNDALEWGLCVSTHVLDNVRRVLVEEPELQWDPDAAAEYVDTIVDIAEASGGGWFDPTHVAIDVTGDHEDDLILDLAVASGAVVVVSSDPHLLNLRSCRGIAMMSPHQFARRVDASRR